MHVNTSTMIGIVTSMSLMAAAFSGCISPGGPDDLVVTIHLEQEIVNEMIDVSGTIEIYNPGPSIVKALPGNCPSFQVQRMSDLHLFYFGCTVQTSDNREAPREKTTFQPGDVHVQAFSFEDYVLTYWDDENGTGRYGLAVYAVADREPSEQIFFQIDPHA